MYTRLWRKARQHYTYSSCAQPFNRALGDGHSSPAWTIGPARERRRLLLWQEKKGRGWFWEERTWTSAYYLGVQRLLVSGVLWRLYRSSSVEGGTTKQPSCGC